MIEMKWSMRLHGVAVREWGSSWSGYAVRRDTWPLCVYRRRGGAGDWGDAGPRSSVTWSYIRPAATTSVSACKSAVVGEVARSFPTSGFGPLFLKGFIRLMGLLASVTIKFLLVLVVEGVGQRYVHHVLLRQQPLWLGYFATGPLAWRTKRSSPVSIPEYQ